MSKGSRRRPGKGYEEGWDRAFAEQRIKELESANLSVAVCARHVPEITQGDCVICELEALQSRLDECESQLNECGW